MRGGDTHQRDSRGQHFRLVTDALARPTHSYVDAGGGEVLLQRHVYGEAIPVLADARARNARGQRIASYDGGGAVTVTSYGVTQHGTKFNQVIQITGTNGKTIDVTFAWIRNNDGIVRLVTGIPSKLKP